MPRTPLIIQVGEGLTPLLVKPPALNAINAKFRPKLWTWATQTSNTSKDADGTATVLSPQQPATPELHAMALFLLLAIRAGQAVWRPASENREGAQAGATTPPLLFHGMPALTYKQRSIKSPQKVQHLPVCSSRCYTAQPPPPAALSPLPRPPQCHIHPTQGLPRGSLSRSSSSLSPCCRGSQCHHQLSSRSMALSPYLQHTPVMTPRCSHLDPYNDRPATRQQPAAVTGCRCPQQQAREGTSMQGQQALDEKTNEQTLQGAAGGRKGRNHERKKKKKRNAKQMQDAFVKLHVRKKK